MEAHDLGASVTNKAVDASARGQPKAVSGVDGEFVFSPQADDEPWPLLRPDWDVSVSLLDITDYSLGTRRQV